MILPDANVWLSLSSSGHTSHVASLAWLADVPAEEGLAFCRVTQLTLLRLLTTRAIMRDDTLTQRHAWDQYEKILQDPRIVLAAEPAGISSTFRECSSHAEISPKRWVDDYLAAFAIAGRMQLVTYDRALASRVANSLLLTP